jgi:hypothetical protein
MEIDEFTHPGLRIFRNEDGFQILLPVKADRFRRLLHLVWAVVGLAGEAVIVAAVLGWEPVPLPPRPVLVAGLAFFTAGWLYLVYRWLWYAVGRERFIVTRDMVRVRREILGIPFTRVFERGKIRNIRAGQFDYQVIYPSWGRMFIGHGEGEIPHRHRRAHLRLYGRGLEEDEAAKLAGAPGRRRRTSGLDRRRPPRSDGVGEDGGAVERILPALLAAAAAQPSSALDPRRPGRSWKPRLRRLPPGNVPRPELALVAGDLVRISVFQQPDLDLETAFRTAA